MFFGQILLGKDSLRDYLDDGFKSVKSDERNEMTTTVGSEASLPGLAQAYQVLYGLVPGSADVEGGFSSFTIEGNPRQLIARELGVTDNAARKLLDELRDRGYFRSESGGRGKPWRRYLRMDVSAETLGAADTNGGQPASGSVGPGDGADTGEQPEGIPGTPEQINQIFVQLGEKLDAQQARIEELEQMVRRGEEDRQELATALETERDAHAITKQELETLKAEPPPTIVIPSSLAKHLD